MRSMAWLVSGWKLEFAILDIYFIIMNNFCQMFPGCPLILTDMAIIEKIDSLSKAERDFICTLLFHTINWFREVILDVG